MPMQEGRVGESLKATVNDVYLTRPPATNLIVNLAIENIGNETITLNNENAYVTCEDVTADWVDGIPQTTIATEQITNVVFLFYIGDVLNKIPTNSPITLVVPYNSSKTKVELQTLDDLPVR